jgi:TolB-like protein
MRVLIGIALLASAPEASAQEAGQKILVLPYQPIYRSVAQKKAQTATDLLNKELSQKEGIQVIRGAVSEEKVAASLDEAKKLSSDAERAEGDRRIGEAIDLRRSAIGSMEKNAGAIANAVDYLLAHHHLARALMWAGDDKEANATLEVAARMEPNLDLPSDQFSRLYRKWFKRASEKALRDPPGTLLVKCGLPGAKISLDGREMDVAPVLLKKAIPGKHLITAVVDGVPPAGSIVTIGSKGKDEHVIAFGSTMGGDAVGAVAEAIAQNELPSKAIASAVQAGRDASAQFVVLGGMAKSEAHFRVHTFVIDVAKAAVKPLDVVNFDLDLLTAESDVLRIVRGIQGAVTTFDGTQKDVGKIEESIRAQSTVNEVVAAPSTFDRRKPVGDEKKKERDIFKPLKGGKYIIKDEEE